MITCLLTAHFMGSQMMMIIQLLKGHNSNFSLLHFHKVGGVARDNKTSRSKSVQQRLRYDFQPLALVQNNSDGINCYNDIISDGQTNQNMTLK